MSWSPWRAFPDPARGEAIEAPIGPGVYDVRWVESGHVIAFGHSANVASTLASLSPSSFLGRMLGRRSAWPRGTVEYRTWGTASKRQARELAEGLDRQRRMVMQRLGRTA